MRLIDADVICFDELKNDFDRARAKIIIMGQPTIDVTKTLCKKCLHFDICKTRLAPHSTNCSKFKEIPPPPPLRKVNEQNSTYTEITKNLEKFEHIVRQARTEAVREFAGRLKEKFSMEIEGYYGEVVFTCDIDELAEEMAGDTE